MNVAVHPPAVVHALLGATITVEAAELPSVLPQARVAAVSEAPA